MNIKQGCCRANESGARAAWPSIGFPKSMPPEKKICMSYDGTRALNLLRVSSEASNFPNLLKLVFFNSALMREKFAEQANPSSTLAASHLFTRKDFAILFRRVKPHGGLMS